MREHDLTLTLYVGDESHQFELEIPNWTAGDVTLSDHWQSDDIYTTGSVDIDNSDIEADVHAVEEISITSSWISGHLESGDSVDVDDSDVGSDIHAVGSVSLSTAWIGGTLESDESIDMDGSGVEEICVRLDPSTWTIRTSTTISSQADRSTSTVETLAAMSTQPRIFRLRPCGLGRPRVGWDDRN
ncbi:hypothetical protein D8S78_10605 [Natrialba swarupiae]|nr:hypothetical protein [Natrialba swarupiae]